ncbi:neuroblast differentiation-associated protein AHNAK-like [Gymnodraco acuticeps]|uniref:Neuroblast differentiation-associated protein AHNAK-like n=1 Tax=Gymnodraco acuticeps TaxID=8218 RepID=A0A6P8VZK4_GYMAC|nr:neuroblast differentiation-associated protein AHNAK-like [Gymnodraco acuticeps]
MCDCFHLALPNWHAASSGTGAGRRLRAPEPGTEDDSTCDEPSQFTERERPRPQGSSPVEEYPETEKYTDSDKECEAEHDPYHKSGSGKKSKKSGLGSMFEKRSTPKMSKLKEDHSPESGVMVKTAQDGCSEGLVYGGGGREGIFIKEVVPESPASNLKLKEGDRILSATVYFDNMSYEDAIQILEHAQAYKVKLCLKRTPVITETEPVTKSDVIPEEDVYAPEMRENGKTKRRSDARISWPKFPSFGKGKKKSRFSRSHSSSEAEEQRKLELSPTTSDTESPIKSQDALKGKKKNKIKLPLLSKRGRISSSEDQDTDAPTTAQLVSPETLESPSGETPQVYVTEELKVVEDLRWEEKEPKTVQHKVELITIDSTLKTEDLTLALAGKESSSGVKSPDGKKKKKECSELKMKILGKDKSHKKDAKAKSSPKRLKTLGASIETADQSENKKGDQPALDANTQIISSDCSRVIQAKSEGINVPKVELEVSDVTLIQKSPQKVEEKTKTGKDIKQKQEIKTGPTFKMPKIGFSDIAKVDVNVGECTTKTEQLTTEGTEEKVDPYDQLSKRISKTKLPKREDIEIPGMEDMSMRTTAKGIKVPKAVFTGHYEKIQAETVQMLIDVDSVKEAVSKLPGFKLPKVDTSGMLIPEEITVIDANAQRISVKTPTKTKRGAHFSKADITATHEISKTTIKLPKITPSYLNSEELVMETKVDLKKTEKEYKTEPKQSGEAVNKREHIIIPGKESEQEVVNLLTQETQDDKSKNAKKKMPSFGIGKPEIKIPDVGIHFPKQNISEQKGDNVKGERTIFLQEVQISKTNTSTKIGEVTSDVKVPEIEGIEYIDSADGSPARNESGIGFTGFDVNLDAAGPKVEHTLKLPKFGAATPIVSQNVPDADKDINIDGAETKILENEEKSGKFKMSNVGISMPKMKDPKIDLSLSKKDVDVTLPEPKTEIKHQDISEVDINVEASIQERKMEVKKPEVEIQPRQPEGELDGQGSKFKKPKFGIATAKVKGPEIHFGLSNKDRDMTLPEAKAEVKVLDAPEIDFSLGKADVSFPTWKTEVPSVDMKTTGTEEDGKGSKFKMPHLSFSMSKVKAPKSDLSLPKTEVDVQLPETKADVKLPGVDVGKVDVSIPEVKMEVRKHETEMQLLPGEVELVGQSEKFKMPKFQIKIPNVKGPEFDLSSSRKDVDVSLPQSKVEVKHSDVPKVDVSFEKAHILMPDAKAKVKEIDLEMKALQTEPEGQGYKFKMPKFGISIPEVKGPAFHLGLSKKDVDVTLPEAKVEFNLPEVKPKLPSAEMPRVKGPYVDSSLSKKDTDITFTGTKAEIKFPKAPKMDVSIEKAEVFISEAKVEVKKPEKEIKLSQTGIELEGNRGKFKIPKFGITMPTFEGPEIDSTISKTNIDVKIPEAKAKVELPEAPKIAVEMKPPEYESERDGKGSKFNMPKFGISMPKVKGPQIDLSIPKKDKDMTLPEAKTEVKLPDVPKIDVDIKVPECEAEMDVQGSKFKMPKFGITFPKVKGPEIDLSISKKDVDVTLPEAKAEVDLPEAPIIDVDMKAPECEAEMDVQESKFKMPTFGMKMPKVKGPQIDLSFLKKDVDVTIPEAKAEVELSGAPPIAVDMKLPEGEAEMDGQGSKFNKPKFGISMPKVKGSETDFSYFSITIPENKLPDVELKQPSAKVEIKAPEIEAQGSSKKGSPSKFKMPTFNFPKFGAATPNLSAEVPDIEKEIKIDGADLRIAVPHTDVDAPDVKAEVRLPEIEVKHILGTVVIEQQPEVEIDAKLKKRRFSMPRFSFSKGSVKAPEVDANVQDVNVAIPEGKVEVKVGEVETKLPECEADVDRKGSKFKMSTFGITMPKVTGTEIDLSLSKKDVDIKLPEAKAEVQLPEIKIKQPSASVEIKAHEIDRKKIGDVEGSLSKPKMPTFTVPTFGAATSKVSVDKPDLDLHIDGATVDVTAPSIDTEDLSVDIKAKESDIERLGSKFKMPKFGISMPRVKGPELDSSLSKKDLEVTLPKAKAEINLASVEITQPEVEIKAPEIKVATKDKEGSPSKFKMPTIKLPTFGVNIPSATVEVSEKDKDIRIDGADITIPEEVLAVHITAPIVDTEDPSIVIKTEGKESKFKLPSLGFSGPQIKQPDLDLGLEKKDMHVTLPAKAEVNLPDVGLKEPSAQVDIKGPQIKMGQKGTEGSPSRFKMPSFKLPKFGVGTSSATVEVPDTDRDITIDGTNITISGEVLAVDIAGSSIETKVPSVDKTETQQEQKGSNFKLPSLGFSGPQIKLPDMDLSLSQKDIHVTQPEATADVKLPDVGLKKPSAEVELKGSEIKVVKKGSDGSTSKFKMPTFKLPKFGVSTSSAAVEVPNTDKEIKIDGADIKIPEEVLAVHIQAPSIDTEGPSIDIKTTGTEHGEKGSKFKLPSLGFSGPQIKRPDIDLSFSKKDVDVTLPEAKAEVKPHQFGLKETTADIEMKSPEIKVEPKGKEGSPSKFKMPSFKLPTFGIGLPSATVALPDTDTDINIDGSDITIPEEVLLVHITAPSIENEGPKVDIKTTGTEHEGKGSKFNMPSFGFSGPSIKRPEIDLSFSKKEFDVTLPETKAEVELPKVGLKENLAEVEIKSPEIKVEPKGKEGSPSKFKMPSFKLPKFGIGLPSATVALPDTDTDIQIDGSDITIPEEVLSVHITAPSIDNEGPKVDIKTTGTEHEGKGSEFNMPSFGFSGPSIKRPEIDLSFSKKEFDVTLPETKAEVELPKVGLKENLAEVEIKSPEIKVEPKGKEGSPSKFKMPSFKLPKFGIGLPSATVALPDTDTDIKIDGSDITIPEEVLSVHITAPSIDNEGPKVDIKTTGTEHEGKGSEFNMPSFGFSGPSIKRPEIDLSFSKKEFDVTLPETKAEVELPKVGFKENLAEVEIKSPEIKVEPKGKEGSPSKFKMPSFKLPKFGIGLPSATVALPDTDTDIKIDGSDITIPEEVLSGHITAPSIDNEGPKVDIKTTGTEHEGKGSKFNMPSFGFSGPSIKRPEIDLSFSKKEFDVTLPETKAEVELPKVGLKENLAEVEIKSPEIKVEPKGKEGSPSKFKMPSFKLPKFGIGLPSATVALPDTDTDIKIDGSDITIPEEVLSVHITAPSIDNEGPKVDIKTTGTEHEGKGSEFNMPSFGFSGPSIKRPEIDLSFSKKEFDVTLPETKAEVELPKVGLKENLAEVEIKSPEIKVEPKGKEGSPSKFKMPSFKLPKFGIGLPSATVALPDTDTDIKIDGSDITIPEEVLSVHITAPSIENEGPKVDIKTTGTEHEGKGSKFNMPSFGFSGPSIKRPEIDLSFSKKEFDVTLPETKAEVELPKVGLKENLAEVEIKSPEIKVEPKGKEGSPSKFKMPSFKLPKFGIGLPSATVALPDTDTDIKIDGSDITIPEEVLSVHITAPSIENEGPKVDIKTTGTEHEGKGSKFNMPSFGFSGPQIKRPDIDLSFSKKEVDVTLPETKAEVKLPVVKLKKTSAEVEIKAPEIKIATKGKEGSPSKYKMPTFKLPTFGVGTPSATIQVQDRDIKINGADVTIPEEVLSVHIAAPNIETEGPSIDIKTKGTEPEGKGNKFKMPSLGFSGPQIKRPDIDISLSKKAVDVTLPEAKTEVNLPQVEIKEESKAEVKRPDVETIEGDAKLKKSSWTMPRFSFSTASVKAPEADVNADAPKADVTLPEVKTDVHIPDIDIKETSGISMEGAHSTDIDAKMKKTRFSLPRFSFSKQGSKESKVDVSVPNVDVSLPEGNVEGKHPAVEVKPQKGDVELQGQESKFKMPKFGISMPKVKGPEFDSSVSKKDFEVTLPETKAEINLPNVEVKGPEVEIQAATMNTEGSPSKFKMPTFNLPTFGVGIPSASVEVPDTDKVIRIDGTDITIPEKVLAVHITSPSLDTEGQSIEHEVKGSKFKLPSLGFSGPQTKRPGIDLSSSKKDVNVTLPGAKAKVKLPEARLKDPSTEVEMKGPEIKIATQGTEGSPSKYKMPTFKLPKFGVGTPSATVKVPETDFKLDGADIPEEDLAVHIAKASLDNEGPSIDIKTTGTKHEGKESKFKLPSLSFSGPQNKCLDIDLSLSKVDGDVTLPEAKAGVKLPHVELKESSAKVEIKAPKIDVQTSNVEGSPSKYKMPTFKLPKFGVSTPSATVEGPNTDINIPEEVLSVHITAPSIDTEGPSINIKTTGTEHEGEGSKFKLPSFGFSGPQVKQPDIDISLSKKDVDVILPETKAEAKETEGVISVPDAPTVDIDTKKQATWAFPRFSFSRSAGKASDDEPETPKVDVTLPKAEAEVQGGLSGAVSIEEPPAAELDPNLKKRQFSLPRFSFSRSSVKEPAVSAELPHVDVSLSEGEVIVKQPEMKIKAPELEAEHDGQGSTFQLPKFGIALPKVKGSEDINASQKNVDITVADVKAKVTLPDIEAKEYSASVEMKDSEIEAQSKGVGGLSLKLKMPTLKMPKFEVATHDVTVKAPDSDKVDETDGAKHKEDITLIIKGPSVDIKTDETGSVDLGSPSKFKLPSFKLPKLSFSIPNAEGDVPVDTESKEDQLKIEVDPKGESKSQKVTLTSFGEIIKNFDVEIDAAKPEEQLETLKEVQETVEPNGKQPEAKEKETKQDTTKSPERTSWLKFPRFGLSSPSEPAKTVEKEEQKDEKSPVGETSDEEISPTSSVQSSDAFADISSAMTSEHLGLSLSSPTKVVTVKFSDPNVASGLGEMHSNIITSTTRTEIISVEPKLPEKITILSSGASSSSEDTLRLDSGKLHVFTSNIQATPESQYAKLLTDFQIQSAGGLPLEPEAYKAASWTVEDPESGKRTVYERHLVKETSSESKETIVITQQITRTFDSSETASSIQRLKDSMHSDKMRFFDGADE